MSFQLEAVRSLFKLSFKIGVSEWLESPLLVLLLMLLLLFLWVLGLLCEVPLVLAPELFRNSFNGCFALRCGVFGAWVRSAVRNSATLPFVWASGEVGDLDVTGVVGGDGVFSAGLSSATNNTWLLAKSPNLGSIRAWPSTTSCLAMLTSFPFCESYSSTPGTGEPFRRECGSLMWRSR